MPSFYTPTYRPARTHWRDSIYYKRVDSLPVAADSAAKISETIAYHTTYGGPYLRIFPYGTDNWLTSYEQASYFIDRWPEGVPPSRVNWYIVTGYRSTPNPHLYFSDLRQEFASRNSDLLQLFGFPEYAVSNYGDRHAVIWSEETDELVEAIGFSGYGPAAETIVTYDLNSYTLPLGQPNEFGAQVPAGSVAASLPVAPFYFTYQDLLDCGESGDLGHMLGWVAANYREEFQWPARSTDGEEATGLPAGAVLRLKSTFNVASLPNAPLRALARTLQKYGVLLYDKSSTHAVIATPSDPNWPQGANDLGTLLGSSLQFSQFDLVDMSSVMIAPDSIEVLGGNTIPDPDPEPEPNPEDDKRIVHWHCRGCRGRGMYGSISGINAAYSGDRGVEDSSNGPQIVNLQQLQSRTWITNSQFSGNPADSALVTNHYALALLPGANQCYASWKFPTTSTYSFRVTMWFAGNMIYRGIVGPSDEPLGLISAYGDNDTTKRWEIGLTMETISNPLIGTGGFPRTYYQGSLFPSISPEYWTNGRRMGLSAPGQTTVLTEPNWNHNGNQATAPTKNPNGYQLGWSQNEAGVVVKHVFEGKVAANTLTVRVSGASDSWVASHKTISIPLSNSATDTFVLGVRPASTYLRPANLEWAFVEVWDDTGSPPDWPRGLPTSISPSFHEVTDPGVTRPLTVDKLKTSSAGAGTVTTSGLGFEYPATPTRKQIWWDLEKVSASGRISTGGVQYGQNSVCVGDLWVPRVELGYTQPHPVVVWAHSGFFTSGTRNSMPSSWQEALNAAGYAVFNIDYGLASPPVLGTGAHSNIEHPQQVRDYKRAIKWLKDNASALHIDPDRVIASGYSAGAGLAMAAALSMGASAVNGFDMRMASQPSYASAGLDPTVRGTFVYAGPVTWCRIQADDFLGTVKPVTPRAYMGAGYNDVIYEAGLGCPVTGSGVSFTYPYTADRANVTQYVYGCAARYAARGAPTPRVAFVSGSTDPLITSGHRTDLQYVCGLQGVPFSGWEIQADHDNIMRVNEPNHPVNGIITWMNALMGTPTKL